MTPHRLELAKRLTGPALLGVVVCAFFHRIFLGERFVASDFFQTFVPLRTILTEAWSRGLPVWTGRLGNGSPVLANPAYALFYPPNLLYLGKDAALSMSVLMVAHFVGGGLGAWFLARRWQMSRSAAWLAAIGFVLSGALVSSTAYPNLSWPVAWLPWVLVAQDEAMHGRVWRGIAGMALAWFSMLSLGEPVVLLSSVFGSALIAAQEIAWGQHARSWRERLPRTLWPVGVAAAAALIPASPLLVAIAHYFPISIRASGFTAKAIVLWSLHPWLFAGMILPNAFGDPGLFGREGFWATALAPDRPRPLLAGLYVGGLFLALAVLGTIRRSPRRGVLLLWLLGLVALALGRYGPIYSLAGDANGFDALRYPTKWIIPTMLPLALLAASGLDQLKESVSTSGVSKRGAIVFLAVLAGLAAVSVGTMAGLDRVLVTLAPRPDLRVGDLPIDLYVRGVWLAAAVRSAVPLGLALLAIVALPRTRAAALILPVVAALATLDLALANRELAPTIPSTLYGIPPAASLILADPLGHQRVFVDADIFSDRVHFVDPPDSPLLTARAQRDTLVAYVGASVGLNLAFNPDTEAFAPFPYTRANLMVRGAPPREKLMLLGAAGASHLVMFRPPSGFPVEPMASIPGPFNVPLQVFRNPFALPRARIVPRLTPYGSDAELIHAIESGPDDLFRGTALVDRQELLATGLRPDSDFEGGGNATVVDEDGRSLVLTTEGPGGFLIVSDTLAPGWQARVDGAPAPLFRVDLAFRATPVPPGAHRVEMRYNPW